MELHTDVNEIECEVCEIDESRGVMLIKFNESKISAPLNRNYELGDKLLALISYDNIF